MSKITWVGKLVANYETGTEGVVWSLDEIGEHFWYDAGRPDLGVNGRYKSRDADHPLENGDLLTVYDPYTGDVLWSTTVDMEQSSRRVDANEMPDEHGQQSVFGYWVSPFGDNGLQRGMSPEAWALPFFQGYEASLTREVES